MIHDKDKFKEGDKVRVVRWPEGGSIKLYKNGEIPGFANTFGGGMWHEIEANKEYTVLRSNDTGVCFKECGCAWPSGMFELAKKAKREGFAMVAFGKTSEFTGELFASKVDAQDAIDDIVESMLSFDESLTKEEAMKAIGNPSVYRVTFEPLND